ALAYARQFCPPAKAAKAVGLIKRAVVSGADLPLAEGLALERELQQQLFESADAREGIAAFLEKRPPRFAGR
ncbi:MAG TPA: enoyl-CoA hydratase-related protein, partial [Candidatus Polarisedimenticolia bacterium]|nr:enoyl-CoA hydratase-related protein [Candidatus Polarisedimenticolia bacterium]